MRVLLRTLHANSSNPLLISSHGIPPHICRSRDHRWEYESSFTRMGSFNIFPRPGFPRLHIYKSRMGVCTSFTCMAVCSFTLPIYHPMTPYIQAAYGGLCLFYVQGFTFFTLAISSHILPAGHVINVGSLYEDSFTCLALLTNPILYASYIFPRPRHKSHDHRWESV